MRPDGILLPLLLAGAGIIALAAPEKPAPPDSFDRQLEAEVLKIERRAAEEPTDKESWLAGQKESRRQLAEMLGLDPMPPKSDLQATKTGEFEHEGIVVENLHFQSLPGLYVTANFYRPKEVTEALPTVLYFCGHSDKIKNKISYGNKAGYEHHGVWYAKNGFTCLVIDTVQLGEIRGAHHGTYRMDRWDWISRGYTPAGVEAWAGIRSIDYLLTRPEVDAKKIGVTGRSGGGAYSWWVAALDERVACAAPTAGTTTLRDHVVRKCVYGHCDCMFMVNGYQWDYDRVASLCAPRPLLIVNTDKDPIFPIDGVYDIFRRTREVYGMLDAGDNLGLHVAEGPHEDVQPLNTGEFHWMLRHLKGEPAKATYDGAAVKSIPMEKLRVFDKLPEDQKNTTIDESFVPLAKAPSPEEWATAKPGLMKTLSEKVFASWPETAAPHMEPVGKAILGGITAEKHTLRPLGKDTEPALDLYLFRRDGTDGKRVALHILDSKGWEEFEGKYGPSFPSLFAGREKDSAKSPVVELGGKESSLAFLCPRGEGPHRKMGTEKDQIHLRRSFYLTGATLESWQIWDIRAAVNRLRSMTGSGDATVLIDASGAQAVNAIHASLFEPGVSHLDLRNVPPSHLDKAAPAYLNVLKYLDIPTAAAMAAGARDVKIRTTDPDGWKVAVALAGDGGNGKHRLEVLPNPKD
ncbi:acetylxylan esterase [Luteolibacter sp. SL250]|uniref:alpha/beta hydrolase n=1 Tax=Luteolibacter sp. SL250 TaxID=2995170 RepID=UPI00226E1C99|nr:acetylxylan esterase [Luteolibacter sp. SL250]WAC21796.1 acetylxylan esterase [Luteolibacter sp. SL250]